MFGKSLFCFFQEQNIFWPGFFRQKNRLRHALLTFRTKARLQHAVERDASLLDGRDGLVYVLGSGNHPEGSCASLEEIVGDDERFCSVDALNQLKVEPKFAQPAVQTLFLFLIVLHQSPPKENLPASASVETRWKTQFWEILQGNLRLQLELRKLLPRSAENCRQ